MDETTHHSSDDLFGRLDKLSHVEEASTFYIDEQSKEEKGRIVAQQSNEVIVPSSYKSDGFVVHRESDLRKARSLLKAVPDADVASRAEVYLGLATTFLGCTLGGLASSVSVSTLAGVFMYCVSPAAAIGLFVAYWFTRKSAFEDAKALAEHVLEYLADPDDKDDGAHEHQ